MSCFIISPIGAEGTEIRKRANQFLELIAVPALERFDFDVIRADKIPHPSAITNDIVRLVQNSDLCLIDLTDNNPNVFYECGRRHETGRPFIQLIEKNSLDRLPFDVAGIRTLEYDTSSAESCRKSVVELQGFIKSIVDQGFEPKTSGASLNSIALAIERLERKIVGIGASASTSSPPVINYGGDLSPADLVLTPRQGYDKAIKRGDLDRALMFAKRAQFMRDKIEYFAMLGLLAAAGHDGAFEVMDSEFYKLASEETNFSSVQRLFSNYESALNKYFYCKGDPESAISRLDILIKFVDEKYSGNTALLGHIWNTYSLVFWWNDEFEDSLIASQKSVSYDDTNVSAVYNLCLSYERQESVDSAANLEIFLRKLKSFNSEDEDHIAILTRNGVI